MSNSSRFGRLSRKNKTEHKAILPKRPGRTAAYLQSLPLKKFTVFFVVWGTLIGVVGAYLWYTNLYMTDERRFWLAVNNSMAVSSITREMVDGGSGNEVVQTQRFHFAPQRISESKVTYTQRSATVDTTIETEGISSPEAQYSRYTVFTTNQKNESGQTPTLDGILGEWSGQTFSEEEQGDAALNYTGELVTLAILGNFNGAFRNSTINEMKQKNVYGTDIGTAIEDTIDGKKVLRYVVLVRLKDYVGLLQKSFVTAGYGEFPPLSQENYRDDAVVTATFVVDPEDNTLIGIEYGTRSEAYSGFGIRKEVEEPEATLTTEELEQKVQEKIQGVF